MVVFMINALRYQYVAPLKRNAACTLAEIIFIPLVVIIQFGKGILYAWLFKTMIIVGNLNALFKIFNFSSKPMIKSVQDFGLSKIAVAM